MPISCQLNHKFDFPISQLQTLFNQTTWANGRSAKDIKVMLKNTDLIFCVSENKKLIGFARILTDYVFRATLWDVIVHSDHHGRGIGRMILENILSHPKLKKVQKIWLFTSNKHTFYKKFGFEVENKGWMFLDRKI